MNKRLLTLMCLFISQISAQSFYEKYHKQILGTTVVSSIFFIGYVLRINKDLRKKIQLKRNDWKKANNVQVSSSQTERPNLEFSSDINHLTITSEISSDDDLGDSWLTKEELEDIYS